MKGIILAGGSGTRLFPLTKVTNKHLLPVGRKPMIVHPIDKLKQAGICEIMIVTGVEHMDAVVGLLGSGRGLGTREMVALIIRDSKVPVIVECMTDNHQRITPEIRYLFKNGVLGTAGSNKFLFDHVGLVEAHRPEAGIDLNRNFPEGWWNDQGFAGGFLLPAPPLIGWSKSRRA